MENNHIDNTVRVTVNRTENGFTIIATGEQVVPVMTDESFEEGAMLEAYAPTMEEINEPHHPSPENVNNSRIIREALARRAALSIDLNELPFFNTLMEHYGRSRTSEIGAASILRNQNNQIATRAQLLSTAILMHTMGIQNNQPPISRSHVPGDATIISDASVMRNSTDPILFYADDRAEIMTEGATTYHNDGDNISIGVTPYMTARSRRIFSPPVMHTDYNPVRQRVLSTEESSEWIFPSVQRDVSSDDENDAMNEGNAMNDGADLSVEDVDDEMPPLEEYNDQRTQRSEFGSDIRINDIQRLGVGIMRSDQVDVPVDINSLESPRTNRTIAEQAICIMNEIRTMTTDTVKESYMLLSDLFDKTEMHIKFREWATIIVFTMDSLCIEYYIDREQSMHALEMINRFLSTLDEVDTASGATPTAMMNYQLSNPLPNPNDILSDPAFSNLLASGDALKLYRVVLSVKSLCDDVIKTQYKKLSLEEKISARTTFKRMKRTYITLIPILSGIPNDNRNLQQIKAAYYKIIQFLATMEEIDNPLRRNVAFTNASENVLADGVLVSMLSLIRNQRVPNGVMQVILPSSMNQSSTMSQQDVHIIALPRPVNEMDIPVEILENLDTIPTFNSPGNLNFKPGIVKQCTYDILSMGGAKQLQDLHALTKYSLNIKEPLENDDSHEIHKQVMVVLEYRSRTPWFNWPCVNYSGTTAMEIKEMVDEFNDSTIFNLEDKMKKCEEKFPLCPKPLKKAIKQAYSSRTNIKAMCQMMMQREERSERFRDELYEASMPVAPERKPIATMFKNFTEESLKFIDKANDAVEEENVCVLCQTNEKSVCIFPCQHDTFCFDCCKAHYKTTIQLQCPLCRENIKYYMMIEDVKKNMRPSVEIIEDVYDDTNNKKRKLQ